MVALPDWAQRVGTLRKELGLKQVQFAAKFGVTQAAISRWESGAKQPPVDLGRFAKESFSGVQFCQEAITRCAISTLSEGLWLGPNQRAELQPCQASHDRKLVRHF